MLFAAVTQEKSFRRAAKRLNMSVPPLVLQIDELEARLKMKLLERTPRGVSPTAQGNAIMPMIDQLVRQAEILDYSVKQMQQNAQGILTIGANTESMLFFIPEFKKRLAALHPNISLFVKEIDSYQVETELTDGTVLIGMAFFDTLSDQRLRMANLINEKPIVLSYLRGAPLRQGFSTVSSAFVRKSAVLLRGSSTRSNPVRVRWDL